MATTFKTFLNGDITNARTLLHEAIPITGTIASGTYNSAGTGDEYNIKNYSHGMFQSVYDYPYLSSSANHIFDITCGYSSDSALSGTTARTQQAKKINIYNQMAQVLMGHDQDGNIQKFDRDGNIAGGGTKISEAFFMNFARLLVKDEMKKGSFQVVLYTGSGGNAGVATTIYETLDSDQSLYSGSAMTISDYGAVNSYKVNSPAGEYGILYTSSATPNTESGVGLLFYQAGVAVLTASIFSNEPTTGHVEGTDKHWCNFGDFTDVRVGGDSGARENGVVGCLTGSTIQVFGGGVRHRLNNIQFNNTTELNSTIYFCRVNHNDFNYSSNPTYLNASQIRCKEVPQDTPVTYITTIGLYSADNALLAVAKLSEPLKKDPTNELTLRVRLDY